jgi:hypothetical protein
MGNSNDPHRRALARAATTDFSDVRDTMANTIVPRSSGFLGFPESPGGMLPSNLRAAKSFHDLRSWSPSPNQGPINPRFPDAMLNGTTASNPNLTSTLSGLLSSATPRERDENSSLINGLATLGLGNGPFASSSGSPLGTATGRSPWESQNNQSLSQSHAPIGSNRTFSTNATAGTPAL